MNELVCLQCFKTFNSPNGHFCLNDYWIPVIPGRNIPFKLIENDEVIWTKEFVIESFERYFREVSENSEFFNRNSESSPEAGIYDGLIYDNDRLLNSNQDATMRNMPGEYGNSKLSNIVSVDQEERHQKEHESKMDNSTYFEMTSDEFRQAKQNPQISNYGRNTLNSLIRNQIPNPRGDFANKEAETELPFLRSNISTLKTKDDSVTFTVFKNNQMKNSSNNIEKISEEFSISSASHEFGLKNTDFQRKSELPEKDRSDREKSILANECSIVYEHIVAAPSRLDFDFDQNLQTHIRRLWSDETFECDFCEKCFPSRGTLKQHEQTHIEELTCCICQQKLSSEGILRQHIEKIHHKTIRLECEICGLKFFFEISLNIHKETHTKKE